MTLDDLIARLQKIRSEAKDPEFMGTVKVVTSCPEKFVDCWIHADDVTASHADNEQPVVRINGGYGA